MSKRILRWTLGLPTALSGFVSIYFGIYFVRGTWQPFSLLGFLIGCALLLSGISAICLVIRSIQRGEI